MGLLAYSPRDVPAHADASGVSMWASLQLVGTVEMEGQCAAVASLTAGEGREDGQHGGIQHLLVVAVNDRVMVLRSNAADTNAVDSAAVAGGRRRIRGPSVEEDVLRTITSAQTPSGSAVTALAVSGYIPVSHFML